MRWAEPELLHLLWIVAALSLVVLWAGRSRARVEARLGDPRALRVLTNEAGPLTRVSRSVLLLLALALAALGLARPQAGFRLVTATSSGVELVIALDVSRSMDARDSRPSRLSAARREALALLETLEGSQVGLIEFAGEARISSPLSTDREGLASLIETATPGDLERPGSNLGAAIELSGRLLNRPGSRPRAILLLSDGENLQGDPTAAVEMAKRSQARLYVIGLGTEQGTTIPLVDSTGAVRGTKRDAAGQVVTTRLDERTLRDIAKRGGGRYERGDGTGAAALRLSGPIRSGGSYEARGRSLRAYDERFGWLAAASGFLLLVERLLPRRRRS